MTSNWGIASRFARRELRGGLKGFRIFLACLALGVGAIAAVGSLSQALQTGLASEALALLSGDAEILLTQRPLTKDEENWLHSTGRVSFVREMRAMGRGLKSDSRALVELKAPDKNYPLYGEITLDRAGDLHDILSPRGGLWGAAVDAKVLPRLGIAVGDVIRFGSLDVEVRALVEREPDQVSGVGFLLAPRVFIAAEALDQTGLVTLGSRLQYKYRLVFNEGLSFETWEAEAKENLLADSAARIRGPNDSTEGIKEFIERVSLFLTLVGLTALLVGGVGVGNAITAYLDGKTEVIATLKCLGASGTLIFQIYLLQVLSLAVIGIIFGLLIGIATPFLATIFLGELLPIPATFDVYPQPLFMAALDGILATLAFAIWPLAKAGDIPPANLFRQIIAPQKTWPKSIYIIATGLALAGLAALAVFITPYKDFAVYFLIAAAAAFVLLKFEALVLIRLAKAIGRPRHPGLRLALTNLYRPGAPTGSVVLSLGLGLTLLVCISLIDGNISRQVLQEIPERAPSFFMMDIRRDQAEDFDRLVHSLPGTSDLERLPVVTATIVRLNGVTPQVDEIDPDSRWILQRERNLTYRTDQPSNATLISGEWWAADYNGPPQISVEEDAARGLGLSLGSTVTFSIVGREITAKVANTRKVDFNQGNTNFTFIFAPGALENAPQQNLAMLNATPEAEETIQKAVSDAFPNVSIIWIRDALEMASAVLSDLAVAVRTTSVITLAAGVLVLAGAMAAGHRRRVYDAVVLKVLGATRKNVLGAYLMEYAILGFGTALVAAFVGSLGAWATITLVMEAEWAFLPTTLASTIFGATLVTMGLGFLGTWRSLGHKAAPVLRAE